jgi:hypothetical protein
LTAGPSSQSASPSPGGERRLAPVKREPAAIVIARRLTEAVMEAAARIGDPAALAAADSV